MTKICIYNSEYSPCVNIFFGEMENVFLSDADLGVLKFFLKGLMKARVCV